MTRKHFPLLAAALLALAAGGARAQAAPPAPGLPERPALPTPIATQAMMLGAAWAGPRSVAVGEHGLVMLSDDGGASQRQARSVPVRSQLTAVHFIDTRLGWAVGHHGVVLHSRDGGESWQLQRRDVAVDRPLFAVHFFDERQGVAVGLWGLVLRTEDGGANWSEQALPAQPGLKLGDVNLLGLFADAHGRLFATAERGLLLRSGDRGRSWQALETGYRGTFWAGLALADGGLLVAGQRGSLYRSGDDGASWQRIALDSKSSITALAQQGTEVLAVGLDGLSARSGDGGRTFAIAVREDALPLTAVLPHAQRGWQIWSRRGFVAAATNKP